MPRAWTRLFLLPPYVAVSSVAGLLMGFQQGLGRNLEIAWGTSILADIAFVGGSIWCGIHGYQRGLAASTKRKLAGAVALTGGLALATYWLSALLVASALAAQSAILSHFMVTAVAMVWPVALNGAPGLLFAALTPPLIGRLDARAAARRLAKEGPEFTDGSEFSRA